MNFDSLGVESVEALDVLLGGWFLVIRKCTAMEEAENNELDNKAENEKRWFIILDACHRGRAVLK